ncbi:MAG: hypothetical protein U9R26_05865 [Campylobacterota bacterium]|nr:hypothetical protein [Campylobacterota bacterium]
MMRKTGALFLLILSFLAAESIHFKEQRYLYALNKTLSKKGTISFSKNGLTILYDKVGQKLSYRQDSLVITNKGHQKTIDLNKDIVTKLFFVVLQAIFHDNQKQLEQFFTLQINEDERILLPKEMASKQIIKIMYKKSNRLDYLHIYLKNRDRISIEQTNEIR